MKNTTNAEEQLLKTGWLIHPMPLFPFPLRLIPGHFHSKTPTDSWPLPNRRRRRKYKFELKMCVSIQNNLVVAGVFTKSAE